jgi:hypothetical protein
MTTVTPPLAVAGDEGKGIMRSTERRVVREEAN